LFEIYFSKNQNVKKTENKAE